MVPLRDVLLPFLPLESILREISEVVNCARKFGHDLLWLACGDLHSLDMHLALWD